MYIKWGNDLSTGLKNIFKAIKDVKTKSTISAMPPISWKVVKMIFATAHR